MKTSSILTMTLIAVAISSSACFAESVSISTGSQASITPLLELTVSQTGQTEVGFGNITPSAIDETEAGPVKMLVNVKSNIGDRYQVTQFINGPLTNDNGDQMPADRMDFISIPTGSSGIGVLTRAPVTASPQVVFTSSDQGNSETISLEYRLKVPAGQAAGNYSALITYTVSSL